MSKQLILYYDSPKHDKFETVAFALWTTVAKAIETEPLSMRWLVLEMEDHKQEGNYGLEMTKLYEWMKLQLLPFVHKIYCELGDLENTNSQRNDLPENCPLE